MWDLSLSPEKSCGVTVKVGYVCFIEMCSCYVEPESHQSPGLAVPICFSEILLDLGWFAGPNIAWCRTYLPADKQKQREAAATGGVRL